MTWVTLRGSIDQKSLVLWVVWFRKKLGYRIEMEESFQRRERYHVGGSNGMV